jgi:hypothetical protein
VALVRLVLVVLAVLVLVCWLVVFSLLAIL